MLKRVIENETCENANASEFLVLPKIVNSNSLKKRKKRGKKHKKIRKPFIFIRGIIRCKNAVIRSYNAERFAYIEKSVATIPRKKPQLKDGIIRTAKCNIAKRLESQTYTSIFFLMWILRLSDEKNSEKLSN